VIIYVSERRPDLLDEVCGKLYMLVTKIQTSYLKKLVVGSAADFSHASRFVVDLSSVKDASGEVIEAIAAFQTMYPDARVIVIADREPEGSQLFPRLHKLGVYDVVSELDGDALKKCLTVGMTEDEAAALYAEKSDTSARARDASDDEPPSTAAGPVATDSAPAREKITANRDFKKHKQFVTVAVCATEPHIGATHHALQPAKFLCSSGFKACYLEANERRNIVRLAQVYAVNANERKCLLQYEGVDMYFDFKLPDIVSPRAAGYDFLIFDFGRFGEFEPASFLAMDMRLVVGGAKAWELPSYDSLFEAFAGQRDVRFIMNHAPPNERSAIRSLMGGYTTYFSEYAPYPFASGVNLDMYKEVFADYLNIQDNRAAAERTDKKGFWSKRR
jgi:hypothetical protein